MKDWEGGNRKKKKKKKKKRKILHLGVHPEVLSAKSGIPFQSHSASKKKKKAMGCNLGDVGGRGRVVKGPSE